VLEALLEAVLVVEWGEQWGAVSAEEVLGLELWAWWGEVSARVWEVVSALVSAGELGEL